MSWGWSEEETGELTGVVGTEVLPKDMEEMAEFRVTCSFFN